MKKRKVMIAAAAAVSLVMLTGACSSSDDATDPATVSDGTGQDAVDEAGSFELHPSISNLPLPPGYKISFAADAYTAEQNERETVVQLVKLEQPSDTVSEFFLTELPKAGFTVDDRAGLGGIVEKSDIVPGVGGMIFFTNPDGLPGQISIGPMPEPSSGTTLNINFYRAGDNS